MLLQIYAKRAEVRQGWRKGGSHRRAKTKGSGFLLQFRSLWGGIALCPHFRACGTLLGGYYSVYLSPSFSFILYAQQLAEEHQAFNSLDIFLAVHFNS